MHDAAAGEGTSVFAQLLLLNKIMVLSDFYNFFTLIVNKLITNNLFVFLIYLLVIQFLLIIFNRLIHK